VHCGNDFDAGVDREANGYHHRMCRWSDGYLISHDVAAGICFFLGGLPGAEAQIGIYPREEETAKGVKK
jgi:hypothetical protein